MTDFFATAPKHLESLLAEELSRLGMPEVKESRGGVRFSGTLSDAYRTCLWSRVANRVLLPLSRFPCQDSDSLYQGSRAIRWEDHLSLDGTFAVHFDGTDGDISHSQFGALRVKDAIVDRFRDRFGRRPAVLRDRPDAQINAYLYRGQASLSIDLSGESLHRRGYRRLGSAAPLKENLAAAILMRAGWQEMAQAGADLVDPLCGSGTLCLEGAFIAADIAPGLLRNYWGLAGWLGHDPHTWAKLLAEAEERRSCGLEHLSASGISIRGYDHDPAAIRVALDNRDRAGLTGRIHFECRDLCQAEPIGENPLGLVVTNPPYGERLGEASTLPELYEQLGMRLREAFSGWRATILTANSELGYRLGLRATGYHSLFNGPLPCRLFHFEIAEDKVLSTQPRPLSGDKRGPGAEMLANRLRKNFRHLEKWRRREQVNCFRLYDADLPEYALAVDLYETIKGERLVNVQEYEAPASIDPQDARRRLREALGVISEVVEVPASQLFFRVRRRHKGKDQYERLDNLSRSFIVSERGLNFLVNFEDYLDTGLFLDHREVRSLIGQWASGRHFLNLFGYTGTASVHAAAGGALSTTTVDLSRTYLDWARRNLALNGFQGPRHTLIQADCLRWPRDQAGHRRWGLILLDPPSFSTSKRMTTTLDIQRDQVTLIQAAIKLLEPGGTLIFSNNLRRFKLDGQSLTHQDGLDIHCITAATLPQDFARNPRIHHVWLIEKRA